MGRERLRWVLVAALLFLFPVKLPPRKSPSGTEILRRGRACEYRRQV